MLNSILQKVQAAFIEGQPDQEYEPTPLALQRAIAEQPSLSGFLPYLNYLDRDQVFETEDGIGFCIEVGPQTGASQEMAEILSALFTNCPTYSGVQIILHGSNNLLPKFIAHANRRPLDEDAIERAVEQGRPVRNDNIYRTLIRKRIDYYLKGARSPLFEGQNYVLRDIRVMISVLIPGRLDDTAKVESLVTLRDGIFSTLNAAMFGGINWTADHLINWLSEVTNIHKMFYGRQSDEPLLYDDGRLIKAQVVDHDTVCRVAPKGLRFGMPQDGNEVECRLYSVKSYPREHRLWQMGSLIGDMYHAALQYPCPFIITLGVHILDFDTTKNVMEMKAARATTNAFSAMAKFLPEYADKKRDYDVVMKNLGEGHGMVKLYHQLALFAPKERMARAEQTATAIWRARGFTLTNDTYMQTQAFLASLPMTLSRELFNDMKVARRVSTKTTKNAIHMAPLLGEWRGTGTPVLQFFGRRGQVIWLDLYDTPTNMNWAMAASSGAGKSVAANYIVESYRAIGAKVWVIDVGRSYEKVCERLGGEFIEFKKGKPICINPFSSIEEEELADDMEMLVPVIGQMFAPNRPITEFEAGQLERTIFHLWKKNRHETTVTDIYDLWQMGHALKDDGTPDERFDQRLQDMATALFPFTRNGQYGKYFDGPATIDFSNDLVVLELEELKGKKSLQAVVMQIVTYHITHEMYLSRNRKKVMIMDEAWDLMEGGQSAAFIEAGYRRARKYKGSFGTVTQDVDDYYKNAASKAALNNAGWLFLLAQKKESIELLEQSKKLSMDAGMKRMLNTVRTEEGLFSEIFISSPSGAYGIGRLVLDPYSLLLYSSKGEDYQAIEEKRAMGMSVSEAIEAVLHERGIET